MHRCGSAPRRYGAPGPDLPRASLGRTPAPPNRAPAFVLRNLGLDLAIYRPSATISRETRPFCPFPTGVYSFRYPDALAAAAGGIASDGVVLRGSNIRELRRVTRTKSTSNRTVLKDGEFMAQGEDLEVQKGS